MNLIFETKYALRQITKTPSYTLLSLTIISFSIAISVFVFSLAYNFSIKRLDFAESESWYVAQYYDKPSGFRQGIYSIDGYTYQTIQERNLSSIEEMGGYSVTSLPLSDGSISVSLPSIILSPNLLLATEAKPILGRILQKSDSDPNSPPVAVLSFETWENYYGGDNNVVGQKSRIDGESKTIVGVLPSGFSLIFGAHFWLPLQDYIESQPITNQQKSKTRIAPIVKLKRPESLALATKELVAIYNELRKLFPESYSENRTITLVPIHTAGLPPMDSTLNTMSTLAGILALFACLNIGTLLFARMLERSKELAIRNAVGSSRWALIRQSSLQSLLVCFVGCLVALFITYLGFNGMNSILESTLAAQSFVLPQQWIMEFNTPIFLFACLATGVIWLLSGVLPAWRASKQDISTALSSGTKGATKSQQFNTTSYLVGFQIVFACFLLIISGTLISTFTYSVNKDKGIDIKNIVTAEIFLGDSFENDTQQQNYLRDLRREFESVTNVDQVGLASALPTTSPATVNYQFEDRVDTQDILNTTPLVSVSTNYFDMMSINILEGRVFDSTDNDRSQLVAIVDENFAAQHWPNSSALGKRIQINPRSSQEFLTIVGVSSHVLADMGFFPDSQFLVYRPTSQHTHSPLQVLVSHHSTFPEIEMQLAQAANRINRDLPLSSIQTLEKYYSGVGAAGSLVMLNGILIAASVTTMILAMTGIFAVMSRTIIQRYNDIGVRRALGSNKSRIVWIFLKKGIVFLTIGSVIGGGLAILASNAVLDQFGRGAPSILIPMSVFVISTLTLLVFFASYIPTKKAIVLEPGDALRHD